MTDTLDIARALHALDCAPDCRHYGRYTLDDVARATTVMSFVETSELCAPW